MGSGRKGDSISSSEEDGGEDAAEELGDAGTAVGGCKEDEAGGTRLFVVRRKGLLTCGATLDDVPLA